MIAKPTRRTAITTLLGVCLAGCTGVIENAADQRAGGTGNGASAGSGTGSGNGSGTGIGGGGSGGDRTGTGGTLPPPQPGFVPEAAGLRRLTVPQYQNSVRDVLGVDVAITTEFEDGHDAERLCLDRSRARGPVGEARRAVRDVGARHRKACAFERRRSGSARRLQPGRDDGRLVHAAVHSEDRPPRVATAAGRSRAQPARGHRQERADGSERLLRRASVRRCGHSTVAALLVS